MTGNEIFETGKISYAAKACIPLNFDVTSPRISWCNGFRAEFWYYTTDINSLTVCAPQYYMMFEIPGAVPLQMCRIHEESVVLGDAPEITTPGYYEKQNAYLDKCAVLIQQNREPSEAEISELEKMWLDTLPQPIADWFCTYDESDSISQSDNCETEKKPENPDITVEYLKEEMAKAIRRGDDREANSLLAQINSYSKIKEN